jgi:hypothetical protein
MGEVGALRSAIDSASVDAGAGDIAGALAELPAIAESSAELNSTMNSAPWGWFSGAPIVGESVYELGALAQATSETIAAVQVPNQESVSGLDAGLLTEFAPTLESAAAIAEAESSLVAAIRVDDVVSPLRSEVETARDQFLAAGQALDAAAGAANALPTVMGFDGARIWLVILQNTSEPGGTGGIVGSYAVATADKGRLTPLTADSNNSLRSEPVSTKGIPLDTRKLWGKDLAYLRGANLDRHYPYAAKILPRTLPATAPLIDDVIALDPVAVAALLEITGALSVGDVKVSFANAEAFFTRTIY